MNLHQTIKDQCERSYKLFNDSMDNEDTHDIDHEIGYRMKEYVDQITQQTAEAVLQTVREMPAFKALQDYHQADEDGVMVTVSRQAIDEIVQALSQLQNNQE